MGPNRFFFLFSALVILLLVFPFYKAHPFSNLFFQLALTWAMVAAVFAAGDRGRNLVIGACLVAPAIVGTWLGESFTKPWFLFLQLIFDALFFLFAAMAILGRVIRARTVTMDMMFGAACAYLLFSMVWAFGYVILQASAPGSLNLPAANAAEWQGGYFFHFLYFSLVTLTTLGYGDITPVTAPAQMLCSVEALFGQLYLAILVARLMGLHIVAEQNKLRQD